MTFSFPHFDGTIIRGQAIGNHFGIATANIELQEKKPNLKEGVYFTKVIIDQKKYSSIMHFGALKTFGREFSIEVHLLDMYKNLYGENIQIQPLKYIRETKKFENADALYTQIENDILKAKKYFLRKSILEKWKQVSGKNQQSMSQKVVESLSNNKAFQKANIIGIYKPMVDREINYTEQLTKKFPEKEYIFPNTENKKLFTKKPDFLIVPARAANKKGERLGQGGGFYDRYLKNYKGPTITFLPIFAEIEKIPTEKHDQLVKKIIFIST